MDVRLYPAGCPGTVPAVVSKSAAHRALLCAAMCGAPTRLTGMPEGGMDATHVGDDILATVGCIEALAARCWRAAARGRCVRADRSAA